MIGTLEGMLVPGEEIRARSELGDDNPWALGLPVVVVAVGIPWIGDLAFWLTDWSPLPNWLDVAGLVLAVALALLLITRFTGSVQMAKGEARLAVTDQRVLWWFGPFGLGRRSIALSRVASATVWAGDQLLILHLSDGSDLRVHYVKQAEIAARALGVPAHVWRARRVADLPTRLDGFGKLAFLFVLATAGGAWYLADAATRTWLLPDEGILLAPIFAAIFAFWAAWKLMFHLVRHFVSARWLGPNGVREFACSRLDRRYQGREPWPDTGGPPWIWWPRAWRRWLLRHVYGGRLDCSCAATDIGPGDQGAN